MRKWCILFGTIVACAVIAYFFWEAQPEEMKEEVPESDVAFLPFTKEQQQHYNIQLHAASPGSLKQVVKAPAKISICSDRLVHIVPKAAGVAMAASNGTSYKNLGERVEYGEVLAQLESKEAAEVKSEYLRALKKASWRRKHLKESESSMSSRFPLCRSFVKRNASRLRL